MKDRILPILFILFFILPVQAKREPDLYKKADFQRMEHWVDSVFDSMSVKERIGQLFVLAVDVNTSAKNKELIRKYVEDYKRGCTKTSGINQLRPISGKNSAHDHDGR